MDQLDRAGRRWIWARAHERTGGRPALKWQSLARARASQSSQLVRRRPFWAHFAHSDWAAAGDASGSLRQPIVLE